MKFQGNGKSMSGGTGNSRSCNEFGEGVWTAFKGRKDLDGFI
jgi:hypothetical protein